MRQQKFLDNFCFFALRKYSARLLILVAFGGVLSGPVSAGISTYVRASNAGDWANGKGDHGWGQASSTTQPGVTLVAEAVSDHWFYNGWIKQTQVLAREHNYIQVIAEPGYFWGGAAAGMTVGHRPSDVPAHLLGWPHEWNAFARTTGGSWSYMNTGWTVHAPIDTMVQVKVSGRIALDIEYNLVNAKFDELGLNFGFAVYGTAASAGGISFGTKEMLNMAAFGDAGVPWEVVLNLPTNEVREIVFRISADAEPAKGGGWPYDYRSVAAAAELRYWTTNIEILAPALGRSDNDVDSFSLGFGQENWYMTDSEGAFVKTASGYNYLAAEKFIASTVPELSTIWTMVAGIFLLGMVCKTQRKSVLSDLSGNATTLTMKQMGPGLNLSSKKARKREFREAHVLTH